MKLWLIALSLLFCYDQLVLCDGAEKRSLKVELNPECKGNYDSCDSITVVYIQAESSQDVVHYIWDFTGIPSLLLANTDKNVSLTIDWNDFMNSLENSVHFSNPAKVNLVSSLVIKKFLIFNDPKDYGNINDKSIVDDVTSYDPHAFTWNKINLTQFDNQYAVLMMNANVPRTNGTFTIMVKLTD
jgi:hypothetical protein